MPVTGALIVGGGPAGAAAALRLARAGTAALVLERSRETGDALCGGFLSWRTLQALAAVGVEADALGGEVIDRVRLFAGTRRAEARLPAPAMGVSRRRLDTLLLAAAGRAGAAVERGVAVRAVEAGRVRTADGAVIEAGALFLASGKHDVRGAARAAPEDDPAIGLRVRLAATPALRRMLAGAIELHLVRGGYAGIACQEDGSANVCLAIRRSRLHEAGSPAALLARLTDELPPLGDRLAQARGDEPVEAIANVPYGWRARAGAAGLFRLGDQAGVIPSLAGEGMGIALASAADAVAAYRRGGAAAGAGWQPRFARRLARPLAVAGSLRSLAEGGAAPLFLPLAGPLLPLLARATRVVQPD